MPGGKRARSPPPPHDSANGGGTPSPDFNAMSPNELLGFLALRAPCFFAELEDHKLTLREQVVFGMGVVFGALSGDAAEAAVKLCRRLDAFDEEAWVRFIAATRGPSRVEMTGKDVSNEAKRQQIAGGYSTEGHYTPGEWGTKAAAAAAPPSPFSSRPTALLTGAEEDVMWNILANDTRLGVHGPFTHGGFGDLVREAVGPDKTTIMLRFGIAGDIIRRANAYRGWMSNKHLAAGCEVHLYHCLISSVTYRNHKLRLLEEMGLRLQLEDPDGDASSDNVSEVGTATEMITPPWNVEAIRYAKKAMLLAFCLLTSCLWGCSDGRSGVQHGAVLGESPIAFYAIIGNITTPADVADLLRYQFHRADTNGPPVEGYGIPRIRAQASGDKINSTKASQSKTLFEAAFARVSEFKTWPAFCKAAGLGRVVTVGDSQAASAINS
jgi:hypothetical protein